MAPSTLLQHTRRRSIVGMAVLAVALGSCSKKLDGPSPKATSLDPPLVCVDQLTTNLTLSGEGLSPLTTGTLKDNPKLHLPEIALVAELNLDGSTAAEAEIVIPDDPENPDQSRVEWLSQTEMQFDIYPELSLTPGVWGVKVTNENGKSGVFSSLLLAVAPPTVDSVEPDLICNAEGTRNVTLHGSGFLFVGDDTPAVDVGGTVFTPTYAEADCIDLPGPVANAKLCSAIGITIPTTLEVGTHAVVVSNPAPAGCVSSEAVDLFIVPEPTLTAIEPLQVCLSGSGTVFEVTGLDFLDIDGDTPTVHFNDGSTDVYSVQPNVLDMAGCTDFVGPVETVQVCTSFVVTLEQDVTATTVTDFNVRVTNPDPAGCSSEEQVVTNYPPPTVTTPNAGAPATICAGGGTLTVTGSNLSENAVVRIGGLNRDRISASSGCDGDGLCTSIDAEYSFGLDALAGQTVDLTVSNSQDDTDPTANVCVATVPDAVIVEQGPLVLYVDPPIIYDGIDNTLQVYAAGFIDGTVARVELIPPTGDNIELCNDATAPPCDDLSGVASGRFSVSVPAGTLASLDGSPTEALFGIYVESGSGNCPGKLENTVRILSVPEAGTVVSVDPAQGKVGENTPITITMTNPDPGLFTPTPRAFMTSSTSGGPLKAVAYGDAETLTAIVPDTFTIAASPESFDLIIITPDGRLIIEEDAFSLTSYDPPIIETVTPGQVPSTGGNTVVITGQNFQDPTAFGGVAPDVGFVFCQDEDGGELTAGSITLDTFTSSSSITVLVTPPVGMTNFASCAITVTNPRDAAIAVYSSLVFATANSGNIPGPRLSDRYLSAGRDGSGAAIVGATRASRYLYVAGGESGTNATLLTAAAGPYALADGDTLGVDIDGAGATTVTFAIADFVDITQATADELVAVLTRDLGAGIIASVETDGVNSWVRMITATQGAAGSLQVTGGTANAVLQFPTELAVGSDPDILGTVEYAPLGLRGSLISDFVTARYEMATARRDFGLLPVGRALYAIGGLDSADVVLDSVERAVVLDPQETVAVDFEDFAFGEPGDLGLEEGSWIYQVAVVFADDDPINPCGESLPSEPFAFVVPDVTDGLKITLSWNEPDTATGGTNWTGRSIAGYRIYRTNAANGTQADIQFLNDVEGVSNTSYEDSATTVAGSIASCSGYLDPVAGQQPLQLGETSRWVEVTGLPLNSPRQGAAVRAVPDRLSNQVFLYAMGGFDNTSTGLPDYEWVVIDHDETTNPIAWESAASWSQGADVIASHPCGGGGGGARRYAGLFLYNKENSIEAAVAPIIPNDSQFLLLGPGERDNGSTVGAFDSWRIDAAHATTPGVLTDAQSICYNAAASYGYGDLAINKQVFQLGGEGRPASIRAGEVLYDAGPPEILYIGENPNDNGPGLRLPRILHRTLLDRAFIYVVGGHNETGALDSVEYGLW